MSTPKFTRLKEDFVCEHCSQSVKGNGYTNHCPKCLWSKHVDINPGDRASDCLGQMKPVGLSLHREDRIILHRCVRCKYEKRNKSAPEDDSKAIIALSAWHEEP